MQKPLAACQGKTVSAAAPSGGKSRKRTAAGGRPRTLGSAGGAVGLESEGRHLVLLVADAQREVVQGAANDGVGAVVQQLEQRYVAVPPHEHCRCPGEVIGKLRRRPAGGGVVMSSGGVFGSTQCSTTGKPTRLFRTKRASLDSV